MLDPEFVDQPGQFYIKAAVFRNLRQSPLAEPLDGLQALAGLAQPKRRLGNRIQSQSVTQPFLQVHHHVQRRQLSEVVRRVPMQDLIVEAQVIESHHQIGPLEFTEEFVDLGFPIDPIATARGCVRHRQTHSHVPDAVPASHFVG